MEAFGPLRACAQTAVVVTVMDHAHTLDARLQPGMPSCHGRAGRWIGQCVLRESTSSVVGTTVYAHAPLCHDVAAAGLSCGLAVRVSTPCSCVPVAGWSGVNDEPPGRTWRGTLAGQSALVVGRDGFGRDLSVCLLLSTRPVCVAWAFQGAHGLAVTECQV